MSNLVSVLMLVLLQVPVPVSSDRVAEARALAFDGHYQEALALFRSSLAFASEDPLLNYYVGITLFKMERFKQARLYFQRAIDLGAPFPEPFLWLTRTALELEDMEEARVVVRVGLKFFPRHEELLELRAQIGDSVSQIRNPRAGPE